jgi:hypothetical protein
MICVGKNRYISIISVAKPKNFVVFAFTYASEGFVLLYGDFCKNSFSVDSNEAMKRGDEALNASSLQFLRSIKRFIASLLQFFYSALNASSPLLFKETHRLMLHRRYFLKMIHASLPLLFKVTLPTSRHRHMDRHRNGHK